MCSTYRAYHNSSFLCCWKIRCCSRMNQLAIDISFCGTEMEVPFANDPLPILFACHRPRAMLLMCRL